MCVDIVNDTNFKLWSFLDKFSSLHWLNLLISMDEYFLKKLNLLLFYYKLVVQHCAFSYKLVTFIWFMLDSIETDIIEFQGVQRFRYIKYSISNMNDMIPVSCERIQWTRENFLKVWMNFCWNKYSVKSIKELTKWLFEMAPRVSIRNQTHKDVTRTPN